MNNIRTMKNTGGFTLIELMIVIAIIAILAAIALPAYQSYVIRTQVSEVITAASGARTEIAEFVASQGALPGADYDVQNSTSKFVSGVTWDGSAITAAAQSLNGNVTGNITLTAALGSFNQVTWDCGGSIDPNYRPGSCQ